MRAANPVVLYHRIDGDDEPLLLLNGVGMSVSAWEPVAWQFAERFRLVRCDFRGQLKMPVTPPADVTDHAEDVVALMDHLELETAHLVGTSFGGVMAMLVAGRYPDRVRSLITIAAADGFDEEMADEIELWKVACRRSLDGGDRGHLSDVLDPLIFSPAYIESHTEERAMRRAQISALPDLWFEGLFGLLDSALSLRLPDELAAIRCPTLVVAAELDGFVPLDRVRDLAESIGGARFEVIKGAGHAVVIEQPQRFVELCLDFLRIQD
jgi:pimeloyl-ACP methyl ester carboxylesterase